MIHQSITILEYAQQFRQKAENTKAVMDYQTQHGHFIFSFKIDEQIEYKKNSITLAIRYNTPSSIEAMYIFHVVSAHQVEKL